MASSIFNDGTNPIAAAVSRLRSMGDPQAMYAQMYRSDPNFKAFADSMAGKTPSQAFREHGMDFEAIRRLIR